MPPAAYHVSLANVLHALAASDDTPSPHRRRRAEASSPPSAPQPLSPADQALITRLRTGDETALEQLFKSYYGELRTIAVAMSGTALFADEAVDDVFETLWRVRDTWTPAYGIRAYLVRAIRNRVRNFLRAERGRARTIAAVASDEEYPVVGAIGMSAEDRLDAESLAQVVWAAIGRLPETTQLILALRWRHGLAWDAIAHATGMTPGAVQMQHHRACKLLKERLPRHLG